MKTTNFKISLIAISATTFGLFSCSADDAVAVNEEELITTVAITLTGNGQEITLISRDLDGDGPNVPEVTITGNIAANTTYQGAVKFLDETVVPADDKTVEIAAEDSDHQVFYQPTGGIGTFTYTDADTNGQPVGLAFTFASGNSGSGALTVTLRHLLDKSAPGVAAGNIENAGGSTDAQVVFPISIN